MDDSNAFSGFRQRLDSWPLILAFGVMYFASQIVIGVIVHPLGPDMLAVQTTLSAEAVRNIFAHWEAAGLLPLYESHYRYDMIHPFWYGVFLAAMLAKGFNANQVPARFSILLLAPFVAAGCDVVENILHLGYIADRASITDAHVLLSNGAAMLKWLLAISSVLAVATLAIRAKAQVRGSP